jgi:hypothetical protein
MNILSQLSSQMHDRTEASNRKVVAQCIDNSILLEEIAAGIKSGTPELIGDCAEVFTEVSQDHPELVASYGPLLTKLIEHKNTRVRWEAVHALAHITTCVPNVIHPILSQIVQLIEQDRSVIVRDYAVDILSNFATTSPEAARLVYPHLSAALTQWEGKHAAHALPGLVQTTRFWPNVREEIQASLEQLLSSPKGVVRKAARDSLTVIRG